jgi:hypothetical protein
MNIKSILVVSVIALVAVAVGMRIQFVRNLVLPTNAS